MARRKPRSGSGNSRRINRINRHATGTAVAAVRRTNKHTTGTAVAAARRTNKHTTGTAVAAARRTNKHTTGTAVAAVRKTNKHTTGTAVALFRKIRRIGQIWVFHAPAFWIILVAIMAATAIGWGYLAKTAFGLAVKIVDPSTQGTVGTGLEIRLGIWFPICLMIIEFSLGIIAAIVISDIWERR